MKPICWLVSVLLLAGCQAAPAAQVEVTRSVEVTRQVEVTRLAPVEITREVKTEVTRQVIATQIVEVTRIVERIITATPLPPSATPRPAVRVQVKDLQPEAVIAAFKAAGLEAEDVHELAPAEYKLAPYVGRGLRFMLPSHGPDWGGRVFYVADPAQRAELKGFYEEMGRASAILASYLYERGNVLLQIPGDVPPEAARQYEAALLAAK